jgi:hypothetical protein
MTQVVGRDLWKFGGGSALPQTTGLISSWTGLGYGVDENGSLTGGFGVGISSKDLSLADSPVGGPVSGFYAGYGGMINGWQHRWGPVVATATAKIGFGGADWVVSEGWGTRHKAGFSILGAADLAMGLLVFPWFNLAVVGGGVATVTTVSGDPFVLAYAPTLGIRLTWGSY